MRFPFRITTLLTAGVLVAAAPLWADTYSFQTINNPADPNFNQLLGINNGGTVVGYFGDGAVVNNNGYVLNPPNTYTAENFGGATQTQVIGINNAGQTVGFFTTANGTTFGFVHSGNGFTPVTDPFTPGVAGSTNQLLGINDKGIAAGFYIDANGNARGYTYNTHTAKFTPVNIPGATSVTVTGIDNAGVLSGFYTNGGGVQQGFIDDHGKVTNVNGGADTMLFGLNNKGQAVGTFTTAAGFSEGLIYNFLTNQFTDLAVPGAAPTSLFGVTGTTINGINDKGDLVGFFADGINVDGFLATPTVTPEPSSLLLLGSGLLGASRLLWTRRRG